MKLFLVAPLFALAACTSTQPTGASCPTANAPTYESFGKSFFGTYCTACHSATSENRHGAPTNLNYDTEAEIRAVVDDIDANAAAGPNGTNTFMPELIGDVKTAPTQAERETLGQFLACEKSGASE